MSRSSEDSTQLLVARLFDFFGRRTPWQRRLWMLGTCECLNEVVEFTEASLQVGRGAELLLAYRRFLAGELGKDNGLPSTLEEQTKCLIKKKDFTASDLPLLRSLSTDIAAQYVESWCERLRRGGWPVERTARAIAAHLLDVGHSASGLHRWLRAVAANGAEDAADLADALDELGRRNPRRCEVMVLVRSLPHPGISPPSNWLEGNQIAERIRASGLDVGKAIEGYRLGGGLIYEIDAYDRWAAAALVGERVERMRARVAVGLPGDEQLQCHANALVQPVGKSHAMKPAPLTPPTMHIEVGSLARAGLIYAEPQQVDDWLELLFAVETAPTTAALVSGWSVIEGVLSKTPGIDVQTIARRAAAIITCSLPRAELPPLATRTSTRPPRVTRSQRSWARHQRTATGPYSLRRRSPPACRSPSRTRHMKQPFNESASSVKTPKLSRDSASISPRHCSVFTEYAMQSSMLPNHPE